MTSLYLSRVRRSIATTSILPRQTVSRYVLIPWLLAIFVLAQIPVVVHAQERLFVPMLSTNPVPVEGSGDDPVPCTLSSEEAAVLAKMASESEQRRPSVTCNSILAAVARARAADMAARDYFSHTNPDGEGPNFLVEEAGYELPEWYDHSRDANNVESIAAGFETASEAWDAWMDSRGHRTHLLGLESFYADQVMVGVGYAYSPDSRFKQYWVVISAPAEPTSDPFVSPLSIP